MQVLQTVHDLAVDRNAGILFLGMVPAIRWANNVLLSSKGLIPQRHYSSGDWWHIRGALPVEPLNAALECLRSWTRPTLMLVGNHDQVRPLLRGTETGLGWHAHSAYMFASWRQYHMLGV